MRVGTKLRAKFIEFDSHNLEPKVHLNTMMCSGFFPVIHTSPSLFIVEYPKARRLVEGFSFYFRYLSIPTLPEVEKFDKLTCQFHLFYCIKFK